MPIISGGVGGIPGVTLTGTPADRLIIMATSPTTADWEAIGIQNVAHGPKDPAWLPPGLTSHSGDDEFNDGVIDPAWVSLVSGGTTVSMTEDADVLSVSAANSNAVAGAYLLRPITVAVGGSITCAVRTSGNCPNLIAGICFGNGNGAGSTMCAATVDGASNTSAYRSGTFNNLSGAVGFTYNKGNSLQAFLRLTWVSANTFRFEISSDGIKWFALADQALAMTPSHMGLMYWTNGAGSMLASFEYFRCSG